MGLVDAEAQWRILIAWVSMTVFGVQLQFDVSFIVMCMVVVTSPWFSFWSMAVMTELTHLNSQDPSVVQVPHPSPSRHHTPLPPPPPTCGRPTRQAPLTDDDGVGKHGTTHTRRRGGRGRERSTACHLGHHRQTAPTIKTLPIMHMSAARRMLPHRAGVGGTPRPRTAVGEPASALPGAGQEGELRVVCE